VKKKILISTGGSGGHVIPATILHEHLYEKNDIIISTDNRGFRYLDKNVYKIFLIDSLNIEGDFVESQAFAFLAIRTFLKLPISFPSTTNCKKPSVGGIICKNII